MSRPKGSMKRVVEAKRLYSFRQGDYEWTCKLECGHFGYRPGNVRKYQPEGGQKLTATLQPVRMICGECVRAKLTNSVTSG
jgi:hypothetical protein